MCLFELPTRGSNQISDRRLGMNMKGGTTVIISCMMVFLLAVGHAFAGSDAVVRQAEKIIRTAERKMHSGKNSEADSLLNQAAALMEQVKSEDPGNRKIVRLEKKFLRVRKNVDKKIARGSQKAPPGKVAIISSKKNGDKLPGGVKKRLKDINRFLDHAERYVSTDAEKANYKLEQAGQLFDEIERNYGAKFDPSHPDFSSIKTRYETLVAAAEKQDAAELRAGEDAAAGKAAMEKQSAEWVAGFSAYLAYPGQEGHNPDMLVFVPGTSEPEKFAEARKRYEKFKEFYKRYKETQFPNGKTWKLKDLAENQAPVRLKDFEEGMASRIAAVSGGAEKEIDRAMAQLEKDNGWKSDNTVKPNLVDHKWMSSIREATQKAVSSLAVSDPKRRKIQEKFDALVAADRKNRQIRKERTFMTPDRYTGSDIKTLKARATSLVRKNKKEGGSPLRCTIISDNWQVRTVREWTDTSKTTWRVRTTRNLTAQVATRTAGGVRLVTVALAQDELGNGGWGPLYGNLHQYSEPMLEENVNK